MGQSVRREAPQRGTTAWHQQLECWFVPSWHSPPFHASFIRPTVARVVSEHATAAQCQGRYFRSLDPSIKKGNWSPQEIERLKDAVTGYGNSWVDVAACIPGRTNEQCRERWNEHLASSSAHASWTEADDAMLLQAVESMGHQWKAVSAKVGNGSTGAQVWFLLD